LVSSSVSSYDGWILQVLVLVSSGLAIVDQAGQSFISEIEVHPITVFRVELCNPNIWRIDTARSQVFTHSV
jgi:hypothetical protein